MSRSEYTECTIRCSSRETSASKLCVLGAAASARAASSAFEWTSVVKVASLHHEKSRRAGMRADAAHIAAKARRFKGLGKGVIAQKKSGSAGRGPADPPACVATFDPTRDSGAGGQKHRVSVKPNHRGSVRNMKVRCGARLTINRQN